MSASQRVRTWVETAVQEHWLIVALLAVPIVLATWMSAIVWLVPLAAFVVGAALQPRHVWVVWLGSVVVLWISLGVWEVFNESTADDGETIVSVFFESFIFMAGGVLLPTWIGRLFHWFGEPEDHRPPGNTPAGSAF